MIARELTPDRLASAAWRLGAAASVLHQGHAAAADATGSSHAADASHRSDGLAHAQTLAMPGAYEHFWGLDFGSSPLLHAAGGAEVEGGMPMGGVHDVDAAGPGVGLGQGEGWERFSVLSSRSVSAARVCGEVLRDKSGDVERDGGAHGDGEAGTSPRSQAYHVRRSQLGCCVVRAVS